MVFIWFCELVLLDAAVEPLVSLPSASREHLRTASTVNGVIAALVAVATWLLAEPFAMLFQDPALRDLARALALLPILTALTAAPIATLRRARAFRSLALRAMAGLAGGGGVALAIALAGHGVWAL